MAVSTLLWSAVFCSCLGIIQSQFFQDPCLKKKCNFGCRLLADDVCESKSCDLKPTCVPPQLAVSRFNPCAVGQPIIDVRGSQIMCGRDQCPSKSYCSAPVGVGVCCYDFKGYFVGSKLGFCRDPPRYFSRCKNDCASDHKCPFMQKCCMSPCGFSCQMSFVG
ncbi:hypothetical protein LOTGIDRAFT_228216 [Lottia gigantea]|uniref:WAP domain-containing protein n=1 Tax=Lottia gigantea TaxID=225164 RepID=V4A168_LOTGI|nr:hypothetical protein LOTGIDRAFT_228216 [Lottia gigantea]ESO97563.1 hypothetical protein LOTGIDRAFT_228216 [Lottia gigantea]